MLPADWDIFTRMAFNPKELTRVAQSISNKPEAEEDEWERIMKLFLEIPFEKRLKIKNNAFSALDQAFRTHSQPEFGAVLRLLQEIVHVYL